MGTLNCCCTPPPDAKELGACCYTETLIVPSYYDSSKTVETLVPACISNITEAECANPSYFNSYFTPGINCGRRVWCDELLNIGDETLVQGVVDSNTIKSVYTPTSRWYANRRVSTPYFTRGTFYNENKPFPKTIEGGGSPFPNHLPVNYFFFTTTDNKLFLSITVDISTNVVKTFSDGTEGVTQQISHQTRLLDLTYLANLRGFNQDSCTEIKTSDMFYGIPNLIWLNPDGQIRTLITDDNLGNLYGRRVELGEGIFGPEAQVTAQENINNYDTFGVNYYNYNTLQLELGFDFDNSVTFQETSNAYGLKFSQLSTKYGGRITAIVSSEHPRGGTVLQAGSYFAGAAVKIKDAVDFDFYWNDTRESESDISATDLGIASSFSNYAEINGLNKHFLYNHKRATARFNKVDSIRNATKIEENFFATAVLTSDGAIYTWGHPRWGGDDYYNNVQDFSINSIQYKFLNSQNQAAENSTDYVELSSFGNGFIGFKNWDGSNNNITIFGGFKKKFRTDVPSASITSSDNKYNNFLSNGKRYEPSDARLINDGSIILKAYEEDNYTIIGGQGGLDIIQGNITPPSAGLTINKIYAAYQRSTKFETDPVYLILWSDKTLQIISFSAIADPASGANAAPPKFGYVGWLQEDTWNNRERLISNVRDVFLTNESHGFGYILETPDAEGYNCELILRKNTFDSAGTNRKYGYEFGSYNGSDFAVGNEVSIENITTNIYAGIDLPNYDTGFMKVKFKKIESASSSVPDSNITSGPDIDQVQSGPVNGGHDGTEDVVAGSTRVSTSLFLTQHIPSHPSGKKAIIGVHYRYGYRINRTLAVKDVIVEHTRSSKIDGYLEDVAIPYLNFDYVNLLQGQLGEFLSYPGLLFESRTNTEQKHKDLEVVFASIGDPDITGDRLPYPANWPNNPEDAWFFTGLNNQIFSSNDLSALGSFEACGPTICHICFFPFWYHKCNVETGDCQLCFGPKSPRYNVGDQVFVPECNEFGLFYPWTEAVEGDCRRAGRPYDVCPAPVVQGCCCAYYQRSENEPLIRVQQISTLGIPDAGTNPSRATIDAFVEQYGCLAPSYYNDPVYGDQTWMAEHGAYNGARFKYPDGTYIEGNQFTYTFVPFNHSEYPEYGAVNEFSCGSNVWEPENVDLCGVATPTTVVTVDPVILEPITDTYGNVIDSEQCVQTTVGNDQRPCSYRLMPLKFTRHIIEGAPIEVEFEILTNQNTGSFGGPVVFEEYCHQKTGIIYDWQWEYDDKANLNDEYVFERVIQVPCNLYGYFPIAFTVYALDEDGNRIGVVDEGSG